MTIVLALERRQFPGSGFIERGRLSRQVVQAVDQLMAHIGAKRRTHPSQAEFARFNARCLFHLLMREILEQGDVAPALADVVVKEFALDPVARLHLDRAPDQDCTRVAAPHDDIEHHPAVRETS